MKSVEERNGKWYLRAYDWFSTWISNATENYPEWLQGKIFYYVSFVVPLFVAIAVVTLVMIGIAKLFGG